ncbi:MAG: hypothetical protein CM15mP18_3740 [Methanobacteriota archaeon]|nr:MAG: hypothetical protein CM15mP18_3740 [Euryarchaeota archaeon]
MVIEPSSPTARWFGPRGLGPPLLALLNLLGMAHPPKSISWAGVLPPRAGLNEAFPSPRSAPPFVASDAVFIALCGGLVAPRPRAIANEDGSVAGFFRNLVDPKSPLGRSWFGLRWLEPHGWGLVPLMGSCYVAGVAPNWFDPGFMRSARCLGPFWVCLASPAMSKSEA